MKDTLLAVSRAVLGLVLVWSAVSKAADLRGFAEDIANYQMLPPRVAPLWAASLPGVELLAGTLLIMGLWTRASAVLTGLLLVLFIVALSQALLRGIDLRCGCFGGADQATWGTVARDVLLLAPAVAAAAWGPGCWSLEERLGRQRAPGESKPQNA